MGLLGIISFLSSLAFLSPVINLFLIPIVIYRIFVVRRVKVRSILGPNQRMGFIFLIASLSLSGAAYLLVPASISNFDRSLVGGIPYIWLVVISIFVGMAFDKADLRAIVFLVFIEIAVGVIERILGVHSIISVKFLGETQIGDTDLLYYNRVFGLSSNSSVYAFKVMSAFAIVLAFKDELSKKILVLCGGILVIGFITSFNRTAIIAAAVALVLTYSRSMKTLVTLALASGGALLSLNLERMFTRGEGHVDLSGRNIIFSQFFDFINKHLFFGNGCEKVWMFIDGGLYHAHNSYLELIASNGIIIGALFFVGFYLFLVHGRFREASVFLVFSLFQYGIWWGLTFNDVVFSGLMSVLLSERAVRIASHSSNHRPDTRAELL